MIRLRFIDFAATVLILFSTVLVNASTTPVFSEDTIAPLLVVEASNDSILCGVDPIPALLAWYNDAGGAQATDNESGVFFVGEPDLEETQNLFAASQGNLCGLTQSVEVTFTAMDSCGNQSVNSTTASFFTYDDEIPIIIKLPQEVNLTCNMTAQDSLTSWIDNHGFAEATDNCASELAWNSFIWEDSEGNSGGGIIGTGPYIPVPEDACDWSVSVSFLVIDQCGNLSSTDGFFEVLDTIPPTFSLTPPDMTVSCELDSIEVPDIIAADNCNNIVEVVFTQTSNRGNDPLLCNYYNYTINREWVASDECQNEIRHNQTITVVDTLPPTFVVGAIENIDCSEIFDSSASFFPRMVSDNCSEVTMEYEDVYVKEGCDPVINRTYTFRDACGNTSSESQILIITDSTGPAAITEPENTIYQCDSSLDFEQLFEEWVLARGFAVVEDNCSDFSSFAAVPGSYDLADTSSFPGIHPADLDAEICEEMEGILRFEAVDFVYQDTCGNISVFTAAFSVADTLAPQVDCPTDITLNSDEDICGVMANISSLSIAENCSEFRTFLTINNLDTLEVANMGTIDTLLDVGSHQITFLYQDCALNMSICSYTIHVVDDKMPEIVCPENIEVILPLDSCSMELSIPLEYDFVDNCGGNFIYDIRLPLTEESALLTFSMNAGLNALVADNISIAFENVSQIKHSNEDVVLEVDLYGDITDSGEFFTILDENGNLIGETDIPQSQGDSCTFTTTYLNIDRDLFNMMAIDGEIVLSAIANIDPNSPDVINPCGTLDSQTNTDGFSKLYMRLRYGDASIFYYVNGATNIDTTFVPIEEDSLRFRLESGINTVHYVATDINGNTADCSYDIIVEDRQAPQAMCKNVVVTLSPSGEEEFVLTPDMVDGGSVDNCGIDSMSVEPSLISCDLLESEVIVTLTVWDDAGNSSSCESILRVDPQEFEPTYSSGVCSTDSIQLFANPPFSSTPNVYNFEWTGPNNFFSNLENPVITNIDETFNGVYTVTITGFSGCYSTGTVFVNIQPLATPVVTSTTPNICEAEELRLNVTAYTGNALYKWYEGNIPTGTLIATTTEPFLDLFPEPGSHQYYAIVESDNCDTSPSLPLSIFVFSKPEAIVNDEFLSVCEGDNIVLGTNVTSPGYEYTWIGPNNFFSNMQNPDTIFNVTIQNQGDYKLVISIQGCASDTAISNVVVFNKPDQPIITSEDLFCQGSTITLSVNNIQNADQYQWYKDGVLFTTEVNNVLQIENANSAVAGDWQVVIRDGLCFSDISEIQTIIVQEALQIGIDNDGPGCLGDSSQLISTFIPDAQYSWEGPLGFESMEQNPKILSIQGEYMLTVTSSTGCSNVASTFLEVITTPEITAISNDAQDCIDESTDITFFPTIFPEGDYTYSWSGPDSFESEEKNAVIENAGLINNGIYTLIVSKGKCDSDPAFSEVDVRIIPDKPSLTGPVFICEGESLEIEVIGSYDNATFIWNTPRGNVNTTDPMLVIPVSQELDEGTYSLEVESEGCRSPISEAIFVEIREVPETPAISGNEAVCEGGLLELFTPEVEDVTYEWRGPNNFTSEERNPKIDLFSASNVGPYQVRVTRNSCASEWSTPLIVNIIPLPTTPLFVDDTYDICLSDPSPLELCIDPSTFVNGAVYNYYLEDNTLIGTTTSICFTIDDFSGFDNGANLVYVETVALTCRSLTTSPAVINGYGTSDFIAKVVEKEITICEDDFVNIAAEEGPPEVQIEWFAPDSNIEISDPNSQNTSARGFSEGENIIVLSYSNPGCKDYSRDTLRVFLEFAPESEDDQYSIEYEATADLSVLDNDMWSGDYILEITEDPDIGSVTISGDLIQYMSETGFVGQVSFTYRICAANCIDLCDEATVTIDIGSNVDCFAPTIFTPNNDGFNDAFVVPCLDTGSYPDNRLTIFNQWGDEVFMSQDYQNNWEGTFGGEPLPVGTYFYILELGDDNTPVNGFLVLER